MTLLARIASRGAAVAPSRTAFVRPLQQQVRCFSAGEDPTIITKPKHYNDNIQGQGIVWKSLCLVSSLTFIMGPIYDSSRPTQIHLKVFGSNAPFWGTHTVVVGHASFLYSPFFIKAWYAYMVPEFCGVGAHHIWCIKKNKKILSGFGFAFGSLRILSKWTLKKKNCMNKFVCTTTI